MAQETTAYPDPDRLDAFPYPVLQADSAQSNSYVDHETLHDLSSDATLNNACPVAQHSYGTVDSSHVSAILPDSAFNQADLSDIGFLGTDLESETDVTDVDDALGEATDVAENPKKKDPRPKKRKRGWRQILKGTGFENLGKGERGPQPKKLRKVKPDGRTVQHAPDPGRDFKQSLAKASQEFIAENLDAAADHARAAIEANPEVFAAHSLLSEILRKQGKQEDSIQVLTWGAHVSRSPTVWLNIVERILELLAEKPSEDLLREAVDCTKEALKLRVGLTPDIEYMLRRYRVQLYKQLGDSTAARKACKAIVARRPDDIYMCREYAELCVANNDRSELVAAKRMYEKAIELKNTESFLDEEEDESWHHVIAFTDIVNIVDGPLKGIAAGKRLARWVLGRKDDTYWDFRSDDDCEFDLEHDRREDVPQFLSSTIKDRERYGQGLPIEIRIKFGILRMTAGPAHYAEGKRHFKHLLDYEDSIEYYYDLYLQAARSLYQVDLLEDAALFYNVLRDVPDVVDESTWMTMAFCYEQLSQKEEAVECFEEVIEFKGSNYSLACARLAKHYESAGDLEKAKLLCEEVVQLGRRDLLQQAEVHDIPAPVAEPQRASRRRGAREFGPDASDHADDSEYDPDDARDTAEHSGPDGDVDLDSPKKKGKRKASARPKKDAKGSRAKRLRLPKPPQSNRRSALPSVEERMRRLQDANSRVRSNIAIVQLHWPALRKGEDKVAIEQWMGAANNMLEVFTDMKIFFPERDKNMQIKLAKYEDQVFVKIPLKEDNPEAPTEFHGISFQDWHHILTDLALLYAQQADQEKCYRLVHEVILAANVFWQTPGLEMIGYALGYHAAFVFNDEQTVIELSRKLITNSDNRSAMAYQLFAAVSRFTYGSNWFNAGPSQKYMLRMVKSSDYIAMPKDMRDKYDFAMNMGTLEQRLARLGERPNEVNAHAILMYGHMVAVANHSFSALPYYFRVLAMYPDNICVNLSIATMWAQNSMKRQTENRHFGITQGLAFLNRYYELRTASGYAIDAQEAEYNVARMWHYLGLTHLAMPAYEKVLALSAQVQVERHPEGAGEVSSDSTDDIEDYSREAALALQNIYALAGNEEAARAVTEKWLVI